MKTSIYVNYTTRSLFRGGQRTVLALFCIAVGVMAIVALQLVGQMIYNAFTNNVRDANGGDISVTSSSVPFRQNDLTFFDTLKSQGTITGYTPVINLTGSNGTALSVTEGFSVMVVDPQTFPVATAPTFNATSGGQSISSLLKDNQIIIDQHLADKYNKKVGDSFDVHVRVGQQGALILHSTIAAIAANNGVLSRLQGVVLVSAQDFHTAAPNIVLTYDTIDVATANQAQTDQAKKAISGQFQIANVVTVAEALKSQQDQVDLTKKFLAIAGLLALLVGGVGIVNTMQVLLSRRRVEIAMLKTVGYRRFDLYLLFGLEAGLLGILGGIIGAVLATGLSYVVLQILQRSIQLTVPFSLDPLIIGGGILIGLFTALIFGLLPIVQAANIRPLSVIRELPGANRVGSFFLTIGLLVILSILFCILAIIILNNDILLGVGAVYGTFIFLALLSLFFALVVLIIGRMPVPERFNLGYLALVLVGVVLSSLLILALPAFGILLLFVSLMGIVVVLLPRPAKANIKMALRNIGRQRGRTTTTLLALFVGVFTIGLILVLGQNLRDEINNAIAKSLSFNVYVTTRGNDANVMQSELTSLSGLSHSQQETYALVNPVTIDDQPLYTLLPAKDQYTFTSLPKSVVIALLDNVEGFDVAHNQLPDTTSLTIKDGRNLNASDVGTDNALISATVADNAPLKGHLKVGSTITLKSLDGKTSRTVTVVGIYQGSQTSTTSAILTPLTTMTALAPASEQISTFYLKIDPDKVNSAVSAIGKAVPNASVVNLANIGDYIDQALSNIQIVLVTLASLSLLAGVIIIANAVALAMLERRRELGILKSVGYTSQSILSEVLIENGVVGGTGALLAMLLVTLATSILGKFVFKSDFGVSWYIAIGLIVGVVLLAIVTSIMVAWGAVRVRPLEVLRYE